MVLSKPAVEGKTLICFPFAGGGASAFREWSSFVEASGTTLISVQYPGRERRFNETLANCQQTLADAIVHDIVGYGCDHQKMVLFGHSFGAAISFEVARRLERMQKPPALVVVSGRPAPNASGQRPSVAKLTDEQFLKRIVEFKGFPPELLENPEFMEIVLPILRADFQVSERFDRDNRDLILPIIGPLMALGARCDPWLNQNSLEGWRDYTSGTFASHWFDGGHFYINDQIASIVERILCSQSS